MKLRALLVTVCFACSTAWAQNSAPEPAADQAPPVAAASATAVTADSPAPGGAGEKVCRFTKHTCRLTDPSLAPGAPCKCGDHSGFVYQ